MRIIKLILLAVILVGIVLLSLANRETVTLRLLPEGLSAIAQWSVELPLFVVGLLSLLTGMLLGYILEWLREHRQRRLAAQKAREAAALRDEVERLRRETGRGQDDVLALLGG